MHLLTYCYMIWSQYFVNKPRSSCSAHFHARNSRYDVFRRFDVGCHVLCYHRVCHDYHHLVDNYYTVFGHPGHMLFDGLAGNSFSRDPFPLIDRGSVAVARCALDSGLWMLLVSGRAPHHCWLRGNVRHPLCLSSIDLEKKRLEMC